ncbi:MAG TPA: MauE/DoxX family redox-associated membrane protein [Bacteroidota bacterium]|nr:MauE/DoxX family redox-associated membrane protein [Bacteroidota bacterium]
MENSRSTNNAIKTIVEHPITNLVVRCLLGGIFLYAGLGKLIAVDDFTQSILNYKIFSENIAVLSATVIPWLEVLCGISLILGIYQRASTIIITGLLGIFTLLVLWALMHGLDISCGCFTQDPNAGKIGWLKVLENCGYILLGVFLLTQPESPLTFLSLFSRKKIEENSNTTPPEENNDSTD